MIKIEDIEFAIDLISGSPIIDFEVYVDIEKGELVYPNEDGDFDPGINLAGEHLISIPSRHELRLGKPLVLKFAQRYTPENYETIQDIFSKKGAYSRFKYFLESEGKLDQWHEYENSETHTAIKDWLESEGVSIDV